MEPKALRALGAELMKAEAEVTRQAGLEWSPAREDGLNVARGKRDALIKEYRAAIEDQENGGFLILVPEGVSEVSALWDRIDREEDEDRKEMLRDFAQADERLRRALYHRDTQESLVKEAERGYAQYFYGSAGLDHERLRMIVERIQESNRELGRSCKDVETAFMQREEARVSFGIHIHHVRKPHNLKTA
jgi:hypothetical protein